MKHAFPAPASRRKSKSNSCKSRGFTLLELLTVMSLIAIVSIAIYGIFESGISVMQRVAVPSPEEDIQIFFEKFSRDLQNSFRYEGIKFEGEPEELKFPTVIYTVSTLGGDRGIGRVTYSFDSSSNAIMKRAENVSDLFSENEKEGATFLEGVESLKFEYFSFDLTKKEYAWQETWNEEENKNQYILAVKLVMEIGEEDEIKKVTRTVTLPAWGPKPG